MIPISELDLVKIGEIIRTHGYKGEAVIKLSIDFDRLTKTELIFLQIDGNFVPFFFSYPPKTYKKSGIIVKFDTVDSEKNIEKILNIPVFIEKIYISEELFEEQEIPEGFDVYNNEEFIGISGSFLNIPSNPVLTVLSADKSEILIPFNGQFLKSTDYKTKTIIFDLPEGLIKINK